MSKDGKRDGEVVAMIARTIVREPAILLLDEVTSTSEWKIETRSGASPTKTTAAHATEAFLDHKGRGCN